MNWGEFLWESIKEEKRKKSNMTLLHYRDKKGFHFEVGFAEIENRSITLNHISVTKKSGFSIGDLAQAVNFICQKITYLEENFVPVEVAPHKTILRSDTPYSTNGQNKEFYEITITPNSLLLQRWQSQKRTKKPISFTITRGIFVRLINDITFSLNL